MDTTMPTPIGYMVSLSESIHTSFMERMLNPMSIHPCFLRTTAMAGYSYSIGKDIHRIFHQWTPNRLILWFIV
jgi:hypothetical protein